MQKKQILEFKVYTRLFMLLIVLRGLDLFVTYQITPDLSREWNPLVSEFGFEWLGFLAVQVLVVGLSLLGFHYFQKREKQPVVKPGLGIAQFVYYYFNECEMSFSHWWKSHFRRPAKRYYDAHKAFIGFVIALSVVLVSLFAIGHNIAVMMELDAYSQFLFQYSDVYFLSVFVLIVFLSANLFFVYEYGHYRRHAVVRS